MAIRAVAFDVNTVRLMGIDANRIISWSSPSAVVSRRSAACSTPSATRRSILMGVLIGLKAFPPPPCWAGSAASPARCWAAFILGFTEVVAVAIFPELGGYKDAFAFLFLILVLLFRPVGIMGDERLERSRF